MRQVSNIISNFEVDNKDAENFLSYKLYNIGKNGNTQQRERERKSVWYVIIVHKTQTHYIYLHILYIIMYI